MKRLESSLIAALLLLLLSPWDASAHPMGNFSISHYSQLTVLEREIRLNYILDFAEIPTFQLFPAARERTAEWVRGLSLTGNGRTLPLQLVSSNFEVRPGAGGLATVRVALQLKSKWEGPAASLHFSDMNFKERIGWKEVVVAAGERIGFPKGNPFSVDRSQALTAYPPDPASSAPNLTEVGVDVETSPKGFSLSPISASPTQAVSTSAPDRLSAILGSDVLPPRLLFLGMLIAFALGALHALSPGHGKTVVASFLVGSRGTARHAVFLGAVVTFTHTVGVFLLGVAVLYLSDYVVPERLYPWIGFISGATILAVGVNLFRQRFSRFADHHHGPDGHSHDIPNEVTLKNLLALGFSGGIVPCPSALVVLLSAIAVHRVGAGLLFIVAFSLGLASVLVGIGILVVRASRLLARFDSPGGALRGVPLASAAIISLIGLAMAVQALAGVTLDSGSLLSSQAVAVLGLGLFLGLKHATDADHVVAVTTFVSQESSLLRSCWIGAFWGLGHTLSLAIAGLIVIGLRVTIPEWLEQRLELGVAIMLVALGANVLVRTIRSDIRYPQSPHAHGLRPLLTGMVHGAAGSAALMLLVLSTIRSPLEAFLYILIFGLGSVLGMLAISFLLALPMHWARGKVGSGFKPVQLTAGLFSCVFGLYLGAEIWMSLQ